MTNKQLPCGATRAVNTDISGKKRDAEDCDLLEKDTERKQGCRQRNKEKTRS